MDAVGKIGDRIKNWGAAIKTIRFLWPIQGKIRGSINMDGGKGIDG